MQIVYLYTYIYHMGLSDGSVLKNLPTMQEMQEMQVGTLGWEDNLEKEMATCSSIFAWKIPQTQKPGGPQSMRSQQVRHSRARRHRQISWGHKGIHMATCKAPRQPGLYPYDQFRQPRLQMQGCGLNAEPPGNIMGEAGSPSTIPGEEAQAGLLTF